MHYFVAAALVPAFKGGIPLSKLILNAGVLIPTILAPAPAIVDPAPGQSKREHHPATGVLSTRHVIIATVAHYEALEGSGRLGRTG